MRHAMGPVIGTLLSASPDSPIERVVGEVGVIVVHESERRHPGERVATIYYTPGIDPRLAALGDLESERRARTGCGEFVWLAEEPPTFAIRARDGEYAFQILGTYDVVDDNG